MAARSMPSPPRLRRTRSRGWLAWALLAIPLVPLVLLGWLGYQGIYRSRQAAREAIAPKIQAELTRIVQDLSKTFPPDPSALSRTSPEWIYTYPEVPVPAAPDSAQELFDEACAAPVEQKRILLERLANDHPKALARSGLPLLPLIRWELCVYEVDRARRQGDEIAVFPFEPLERAVLFTHPSSISSELLDRARQLNPTWSPNPSALELWESRENKRRKFALALAKPPKPNLSALIDPTLPGWMEYDETFAYALRQDDHYAFVTLPSVSAWAENRIAGPERMKSPALVYPGLRIPLWLRHIQLRGLVFDGGTEVLAQAQSGEFFVGAVIDEPALFFAEQDRQARWLATLLACALLAVAGAFIALSRALARERQLGELKSDFLSSVSHELRAPVASMRLMAENLVARTVTGEARQGEYHRLIADECRRLSALIGNVLDFARIEQGRQEYQFEETDLPALIADTVRLLAPRAEARRQTLQVSVKPLDQIPQVDGLAVQQALINLVDNALKFAPPESPITITLAPRDATHWQLSVADHGPGIDPAEHARIFERFYRVGSELRRETPGAGIGLSLVKHLAESHGGRVEVESQPGKGARFTLILPFLPFTKF
jgi:signal transduction histidine kinase